MTRQFSKVPALFWVGKRGARLEALSVTDKLVAIYLATNSHVNSIGVYIFSPEYMACELKISHQEARQAIIHLCEIGYCCYDLRNRYIWVCDFLVEQYGTQLKRGDNCVKHINAAYRELPALSFLGAFYKRYQEAFYLQAREKPSLANGDDTAALALSPTTAELFLRGLPLPQAQTTPHTAWLDPCKGGTDPATDPVQEGAVDNTPTAVVSNPCEVTAVPPAVEGKPATTGDAAANTYIVCPDPVPSAEAAPTSVQVQSKAPPVSTQNEQNTPVTGTNPPSQGGDGGANTQIAQKKDLANATLTPSDGNVEGGMSATDDQFDACWSDYASEIALLANAGGGFDGNTEDCTKKTPQDFHTKALAYTETETDTETKTDTETDTETKTKTEKNEETKNFVEQVRPTGRSVPDSNVLSQGPVPTASPEPTSPVASSQTEHGVNTASPSVSPEPLPTSGPRSLRALLADMPTTSKTPEPQEPAKPAREPSPIAKREMANIQRTLKISEIFNHWRKVMRHPNAKLDDKRKRLIRNALEMGYSQEDLCRAIDGCSVTPHNIGQNDRNQRYDGLHIILRSADQIDRFMGNRDKPPKVMSQADQLSASNAAAMEEWLASGDNNGEVIDHASV